MDIVKHMGSISFFEELPEEQIEDLWFRDASLLLIREVELGTFRKTFHVDNYLMSEKAGKE